MSHSVQKSITVEAAREVAFRVFTEHMSLWWPLAHHIGTAPLLEVILEPRVGGRDGPERTADGAECDWGRVVAWEPPSRVVLGWQIDADFKPDPNLTTEVEVRFVAETPTRTRVELEHKNLDRFGAREAELRAAFDSARGWMEGLGSFARAAARGAQDRVFAPAHSSKAHVRPGHVRNGAPRHAGARRLLDGSATPESGAVIAFGPVADPKGGWGVAIVEVEDDAAVRKLTDGDPVMRHAIGARYEVLSMPRVILRR